jgi:hypothetical protein
MISEQTVVTVIATVWVWWGVTAIAGPLRRIADDIKRLRELAERNRP